MDTHLDGNHSAVRRFLRETLARHVVLVVLRLYDRRGQGPSGETASVPVLLEYAVRSRKLETKEAAVFTKRLESLKADLEGKKLKFSELRAFRNAELAHSLHRTPSPTIGLWPVWEFAHDTYELVLDLDSELVKRGASEITSLDRTFDDWRDFGEAFWSSIKMD